MDWNVPWMVACFLETRVENAVTLTAYDNKTQIQFLPDDIKSLSTLFWAQAKYQARVAGNRCSEIYYCVSITPAVFVLIMTNQIGIRQKNIVFEPMVDSEIWNYPAYGYSIRTWNPISQTIQAYNDSIVDSATLQQFVDSQPPIDPSQNFTYDFTNPRFLPFVLQNANPVTTSYIGIEITISFVQEDYPYHGDQRFNDTEGSQSYLIVMELDVDQNISGGQYAQTIIPTFVWTPDENSPVSGPYDGYVPTFNGTVSELKNLSKYAVWQSQYGVTVLKSIMKYLHANSVGDGTNNYFITTTPD